jgi:predicted alpha/beta hydrolase family esterase/diadenosine tetraphosphate (Ap4A) HIT family hydrolase
MTRVLTLPGWQGSGPDHWQTLWERLDATIARVQQPDWERPHLDAWREVLHAELRRSDEPTVLVAHSLGCHLVAHAAPPVVGALLVAPPDLERQSQLSFSSFLPVPRARLPFPAVVVASSDDPWSTPEYSMSLADAWGARFVDAGARGHLNSASGLGTWREGRELLRKLCARAPFVLDGRLKADTHLVAHGPLSELLLMNDARYPWFVLVPRRSAVTETFELDPSDRAALAAESSVLAAALANVFDADKVNVGALGNVVRQLHVHHVVRKLGDVAWPGPVWGHSPRVPYQGPAHHAVIERLMTDPRCAEKFGRPS